MRDRSPQFGCHGRRGDRANGRHCSPHGALLDKPAVEPGGSRIEALLRAIKRPYSGQIKRRLEQSSSPLLQKLTIRQRPGVTTFRYWQEGPGYDRNLVEPKAIQAAIEYIHFNPVRRRLCRRAVDWRWSSARWYADPTSVDSSLPRLSVLPAEWLIGA